MIELNIIILSLFLYAGVFIFDFIPQIKNRNFKTVYLYIPIFLFTLVVNILYGLGFDIPSPYYPIKDLVYSLFHLEI